MTLQIDVLGFTFDDAEPAFVLRDGYYLHIAEHKLYGKASFDAKLTAEGKAFDAKELGVTSAAYKATHSWSGYFVGNAAPVVGAPITVAVTKTPTTTADDTGEVTIGGGPADKAYTITLTIRDAKSGGDDVQNVAIAKGDNVNAVLAKLIAAISDPNAVGTIRPGGVLEVSPAAGSTLTKLQVSIA